MQIKFWGTRGSLPRPSSHNDAACLVDNILKQAKDLGLKTISDLEKAHRSGKFHAPYLFGGNTSCTEISHGDDSIICDMGSGLREAGAAFMKKRTHNFTFFLTHMHWDHLMGLPFFVPIYMAGTKITIYHTHRNTEEFVRILFNGVNFPVAWDSDQIKAKFDFKLVKMYKPVKIGGITVTGFSLDHPGGSFGYRFEAGGKSIAVGVDGEFRRTSREDLGKDLKFYQDLDLLVFDSQYDYEELKSHFDWGHCTPRIGVDLALRECIRGLAFTHHDPSSDEEKLRRMYQDAKDYASENLSQYKEQWRKVKQPKGPHLYYCYDGLEIKI